MAFMKTIALILTVAFGTVSFGRNLPSINIPENVRSAMESFGNAQTDVEFAQEIIKLGLDPAEVQAALDTLSQKMKDGLTWNGNLDKELGNVFEKVVEKKKQGGKKRGQLGGGQVEAGAENGGQTAEGGAEENGGSEGGAGGGKGGKGGQGGAGGGEGGKVGKGGKGEKESKSSEESNSASSESNSDESD